tara:strand:- start:2730 stop:3380 length:651 start_codon:yes stop_codon:yes gene_type:complete
MTLWANTDDAANSTIFAASQVNKTPNTANQTALFGNTTADAFVTGATIGQFGVTQGEAVAARAEGKKVTHSGWVLETIGSGGRAGRVQREVLVAMNTISGDAEDASFPDYTLSFTTQPANSAEVSDGGNDIATFTVVAASAPAGASISYLWQYTTDPGNTASYATTAAVLGFADQATATLSVSANTIADATLVRCRITASGADNVFSNGALLTVVA